MHLTDVCIAERASKDKIEFTSITNEDTENLLSDCDEQKEHLDQGKEQKIAKSTLLKKKLPYKIEKVLIHGSFYAVGLCIPIVGGVLSCFHPHVGIQTALVLIAHPVQVVTCYWSCSFIILYTDQKYFPWKFYAFHKDKKIAEYIMA